MALKYLVDLNLNGNEIQNVALQTVAGEPTGLAQGHVIYDTLTNQVKVYNGTNAWNVVGLTADDVTLATNTSGVIRVKDGGISNAKLATDAVSTLKIANDAVTFAKLQNIGNSTIVGRNVAGDGNAQALTATEVRTILNVEDGANAYVLPEATATVLGGVKQGNYIDISAGVISISNQVATLDTEQTFTRAKTFSADTAFGANVTVTGNLTVNGTTTTVNSTDLEVTDKLVTFNFGNTVAAAADGSGFQVTVDATTTTGIVWNDAQQRFVWLEGDGTAARAFAFQDEIRTNEQIEDLVGAMVSGNTETGISVTYNDTTGKLNFDVPEQRSAEAVMDLVADVMVTNPTHVGIFASDDDASNAVTLTNQYIHNGFNLDGHAGGTFSGALSTAGLNPHPSNPITVQVFERNIANEVRTLVITEVVIDVATDSFSIELPAGDYYIALAGHRA